jgi:Galactose oxidase, central domain
MFLLGVLVLSGALVATEEGRSEGPRIVAGTAWAGSTCPRGTAGDLEIHSGCEIAGRSTGAGPFDAEQALAWSPISESVPGNVSGAGVVTDSNLSEAVQFGGTTPSGLTNATELYNASTDRWTVLQYGMGIPPSAVPSPRTGLSLAGDPTTGVAVLFGGETNLDSGSSTNDTWVFDFAHDSWTNVSQPSGPAPREQAAFAIDPSLGIGLLFGGWNPDYEGTGEVTFSDTWELNLTTYDWTRVSVPPGSGPPALHGISMAWDPLAGTFDAFGGCYPCSNVIWQFAPGTGGWTPEPPAAGTVPAARMEGVWSYDPYIGADVLFGGTDGTSTFSDTSVFLPIDNTWVPQSTGGGPPARYGASADWFAVPGNESLLMTGGFSGNTTVGGSWRLASTATLSVEVVNATNGVPVPEASVAAQPEATLTTDVAGYANFTVFPSEEVDLTVTAPGFGNYSSLLWVSPATTTSVVVPLHGVAPSTVDAFVTDATGSPVAGAVVNVSIHGLVSHWLLTTDAKGWSNFTGIPASLEGTVTAWAPGNYTASRTTGMGSGRAETVSLSLIPLPRLQVDVTGLLPNGTVVPLANASVNVDGKDLGVTLSDGVFSITTPGTGDQSLLVSAAYFRSNSTTFDLPVSGSVVVPVRLVSDPPAILDLNLLDARTLLPISAGRINFTDLAPFPVLPPHVSEPTSRGLLIGPVLPGNYSLTAWAPGYRTNSTIPPQWLQPSVIDALTVLLTPAPLGVLDAVILDNSTHAAIAGATVTLVGTGTLTTLPSGWANFTALAAETYEIVASATGYDTNETAVVVGVAQVIPRFPMNLTRAPSSPAPGGQNDEALLPPDAVSVWPLLLLPVAALAVAVLYLTMLRAPEAAPEDPPPPPREAPGPGTGLWRRLRPSRAPKVGSESSNTGPDRP